MFLLYRRHHHGDVSVHWDWWGCTTLSTEVLGVIFQVLLVAGDTFRAAAAEQLAGWAERSKAQLLSANNLKQRPDSLMYSAVDQVCQCLSFLCCRPMLSSARESPADPLYRYFSFPPP